MNTIRVSDATIAALIEDAIGRTADASPPIRCLGPTYVAFRRSGRRLAHMWREEQELAAALHAAVAEARGILDVEAIDAVELCLSREFRVVPPGGAGRLPGNAQRGILGLELSCNGSTERAAPTEMIAANRSFEKAMARLLAAYRVAAGQRPPAHAVLRTFAARQVLVRLGPPATAVTLLRGNRPVPLESVSAGMLSEMAEGMGAWLLRNQRPDGRLTYKYWPSRGTNSPADNPIRQLMATRCLIRFAVVFGRSEAMEAAHDHLASCLQRFFRVHDGVGTMEHDGKAKLGAAALAALAILEHPQGQAYAREFDLLCQGVQALWRADGSFRTFHRPSDRNDNQNFYPGEALLLWAHLYRRRPDPDLLRRWRLSAAYYRRWHRAHRNPAFVPWHTQAYAVLYDCLAEPELCRFVFEMNDWLLPLQQWEAAPHADQRGRFYDPARPDFGPPHAASTGAYLEGLAEAFRLASAAGDEARRAAYAAAIRRGLRNLRQLQFVEETEMFYISKRNRVLGGLRTECYDNTIRVDNVQHALMAILALHGLPGFAHAEPAPTTATDIAFAAD